MMQGLQHRWETHETFKDVVAVGDNDHHTEYHSEYEALLDVVFVS